jgi:hypothetical protein
MLNLAVHIVTTGLYRVNEVSVSEYVYTQIREKRKKE